MFYKKIFKVSFLVLFFSVSLYSEDILDMLEAQKNKKIQTTINVWTSDEKEFGRYNLSLVGDEIKYDKNGDIAMFITTERMNIDLDDIFKSLKFDTTQDKKASYMCSVIVGVDAPQLCDHPFYSAAAGDDLAGTDSALFNIATSFFSGTIGTKKKFDKNEFAKIIMDNEDLITKIIKKIIMMNIPPHSNEQILVQNTSSIQSEAKQVVKKSKPVRVEPIEEEIIREEAPLELASNDGFAQLRQSEDIGNTIEDYCRTQWIQMYGEQYPPPRTMEEIKIQLPESASELVVTLNKEEFYIYVTDIVSEEGISGLSFKARSGKSVHIYKNGNLFMLEGGSETLKAKCRPLDI